jgi:hypothetical protein
MQQWSTKSFHAQHFLAILAEGQIDLYAGSPQRTLRLLEERWSEVTHSLILRVRFNRAELYQLRARLALAAAARAQDITLLQSVTSFAQRLAREPVRCGKPWSALLLAGVHACRGQISESIRWLDRAVGGFENVNMALYAHAACHRKGALLGGTRGIELVERSLNAIRAENVQMPERVVDMLAPGFPFQ